MDNKNFDEKSKQKAPIIKGPMAGGAMRGMVTIDKPKDFKGTMKKLIKYLSKYKLAIIIVILFAIISTIFAIIGPKILGNATTIIFEGVLNIIADNGIEMDFNGIKKIIYLMLGLYLISAIFSYLQGFIMTGVSMKITYKLRKDIQTKINKLPLKYFDKKSYGEVISYITNDIDIIAQNLNQGLTQIITSTATVIGVLVMMFSISWQMSIVAILVLPLSLIIVIGIIKKSQKHFKAQQEYLGYVNRTYRRNIFKS